MTAFYQTTMLIYSHTTSWWWWGRLLGAGRGASESGFSPGGNFPPGELGRGLGGADGLRGLRAVESSGDGVRVVAEDGLCGMPVDGGERVGEDTEDLSSWVRGQGPTGCVDLLR